MFRVEVISADGRPHAVTVQVDTHRKVPSKAVFNHLADRLRVPRREIDEVLGAWSQERLRAHLAGLTHEQPPGSRLTNVARNYI
jgi:hypothetical protein